MPNYCEYRMRVKGLPKNVDSFITLIQAEYNEVPKHFWRVFSADVMSYDEHAGEKVKQVDIFGDCAWSVYSCMCEGTGTYFNDTPESSTSLIEQSKLLGLSIEVFGSEPGVGFQEHYLYENGKELIYDCTDYSEMYFMNEDEFNIAKKGGFFKEYIWDDVVDGYIKEGGFDYWGCFRI